MNYLYAAICAWFFFTLGNYLVLWQNRTGVSKVGWITAGLGTLSTGLLYYFLWTQMEALSQVFTLIFQIFRAAGVPI
jgi:hypothetical protein